MSAALPNYDQVVQGMYIAYYGRPADPDGLAYWVSQLMGVGGNLSAIVDAFGNSDEALALYGSMSAADKINAIYQTLFGRDADAGGLAYYSQMLASGQASHADIAKRILDGVQGDDLTAFNQKLQVAQWFTSELVMTGLEASYAGDQIATQVRVWFAQLSAQQDLQTLQGQVADFITHGFTVPEPAPPLPESFALPSGAVFQIVWGTQGDDQFVISGSDNTLYVGLAGNDHYQVTAEAQGSYFLLAGGGNDQYQIAASSAQVHVLDAGGQDSLRFEASVQAMMDADNLVYLLQSVADYQGVFLWNQQQGSDDIEHVQVQSSVSQLRHVTLAGARIDNLFYVGREDTGHLAALMGVVQDLQALLLLGLEG